MIAARGTPSKELECLGKDAMNAKLIWLPDGRLQVTVLGGGDAGAAGTQRIYDVVSGKIETVPPANFDLEKTTWSPRTVNEDGERLTATSEGGHGTVVVTGTSGSRTVFDEKGGSQYSIGNTPSWSPDGAFILLTDSSARLLVVNPNGGKAQVLAEELGNGWAVTDRDLFGTGPDQRVPIASSDPTEVQREDVAEIRVRASAPRRRMFFVGPDRRIQEAVGRSRVVNGVLSGPRTRSAHYPW